MYRKILVGYDSSAQAKDALALGQTLAGASGAKLVVGPVLEFDPVWERRTQTKTAAKAAGASVEVIAGSEPARGLHELAEEIEADLILVGSAHLGRLGQALAGSVGRDLLHGSPCAVGVAPRGYQDHQLGISAMVVGFDGSPESGQALVAATDLCVQTRAKLRLVAVAEPPPVGVGMSGVNLGWYELKEALEEQLRDQLRDARETVPEGIDVETSLIGGDPAGTLAGAASPPGSLLMVGSRTYGPVRRVVLGSVSAALVRSAPCPVIVHPRGIHPGHGAPDTAEAEAIS